MDGPSENRTKEDGHANDDEHAKRPDRKKTRPPRKRKEAKSSGEKKKKAPKEAAEANGVDGDDDEEEKTKKKPQKERPARKKKDDSDTKDHRNGTTADTPPVKTPPEPTTAASVDGDGDGGGGEEEEKKEEKKQQKSAPAPSEPEADKSKSKRKKRERKSKRDKGGEAPAKMAGLVTKDPKTGGPIEFNITSVPGRIALLNELLGGGGGAAGDAGHEDEPSAGVKTHLTPSREITAAVTAGALDFVMLPERQVDMWPVKELGISFDMQHADSWLETTAYSSEKTWDVNTPIRIPAVKEAIDIPLRAEYFANAPALAAQTGILSGLPTRNLVVIHSVTCSNAVCDNMFTDFSAVFCALKPLSLTSRYPVGQFYGRDLALDSRMIQQTFKSYVPYSGGSEDAKKRKTDKATESTADAMSTAMTMDGKTAPQLGDDPHQRAIRDSTALAGTLMFSSLSDKYASWLQKQSTKGVVEKQHQKKQVPDAHWDTRLPQLDLSLYMNRYFWQDVFDSPYGSVMPLLHSSKTMRDHWRAHPTIPVMRKPRNAGNVVFMRAPAVGMRVPERDTSHACKGLTMYTNSLMSKLLDMEDKNKDKAREIRRAISSTISVDLNAEMVTAVQTFVNAQQTIDAYLADIKASSPSSGDGSLGETIIRARINDYSRYRLVLDTRRDFRQFRCWIDQYVYMRWQMLIQTEARRVLDIQAAAAAAAAVASTDTQSPAPAAAVVSASASLDTATTPVQPSKTIDPAAAAAAAATADSPVAAPIAAVSPEPSIRPPAISAAVQRQMEEQLKARAFVQEGPYLVISVRRDLLFEFASHACAAAQTEVVDLNTAHLTLIPHKPMDVISDTLDESEKSARPRISVQVAITFTHVSC